MTCTIKARHGDYMLNHKEGCLTAHDSLPRHANLCTGPHSIILTGYGLLALIRRISSKVADGNQGAQSTYAFVEWTCYHYSSSEKGFSIDAGEGSQCY